MRCGFDHWSTCRNIRGLRRVVAGVPSRICTVTNQSRSLTYTVASSFVCTSPLAVMTVCWDSGDSNSLSSAKFRSFLLSMCVGTPESTTNVLSSGFVKVGAGTHQTSEREECRFVVFFELENTCCHFPHVSASASLPFQSLFLRPVLKFGSMRNALTRISTLNHTLRWTLSFPNFHVA